MKQKADLTPATKDDLKQFATKDDLQNALGELYERLREDQVRLETRIDIKIDNKMDGLIDKEDHRRYRDETMTRFDGVMGELVNSREERAFLFHENKQLSSTTEDHEKRITTLEQS